MPKTESYALPQLLSPRQPFRAQFPERMIWTASSLKLFRSCKRKWFWKYIMRLLRPTKDTGLIIGSAFHECVGYWYKRRRSSMTKIAARHIQQLQDYYDAKGGFYSQDERDKMDIAINNFGGMMLAYAEQYDHQRKKWHIVP